MPVIVSNLPGDLSDKLRALASDSPKQYELISELIDAGQTHLFDRWIHKNVPPTEIRDFASHLATIDASLPDGLLAYVKKAQKLVKGKSSFEWKSTKAHCIFNLFDYL